MLLQSNPSSVNDKDIIKFYLRETENAQKIEMVDT